MKIVKSYGIACCRKNIYNTSNKYEILFIKKRLTYNFIEFVNGKYNEHNSLQKMFNCMNTNEKILILTFNFKIIWYHCNLLLINSNRYKKAKDKFEKLHKYDNGKKIKTMIENSKNENLIWEIPKGRCKKNENTINTAIREFEEETNIDKLKYKLLYNKEPIVYSFYDNNINYIYYYYIGIMLDNIYEPKINFLSKSMIFETSNIKFIDINKIRLYNNDKNFFIMLKKIIKIVKNINNQ